MDRKKLSIALVLLIILIFFANYGAMKFYWYGTFPWLDMLMHFLGGLWLSLLFIYLFNPDSPLKIILFVLAVGILWEIFEVTLSTITVKDHFDVIDTLSDLFFDLLGGSFPIIYNKLYGKHG